MGFSPLPGPGSRRTQRGRQGLGDPEFTQQRFCCAAVGLEEWGGHGAQLSFGFSFALRRITMRYWTYLPLTGDTCMRPQTRTVSCPRTSLGQAQAHKSNTLWSLIYLLSSLLFIFLDERKPTLSPTEVAHAFTPALRRQRQRDLSSVPGYPGLQCLSQTNKQKQSKTKSQTTSE